jgi:hypothetical protein
MTEMLDYRARYYDPQSGRFISEDPITFDADDLNFYGYAGNNSPNLTDSSGLSPDWWDRFMAWLSNAKNSTGCGKCDPDGYRDANPKDILQEALKQKGKPYGGKGPDSFDCSGLVCYAIRQSVNPAFPDLASNQRTDPKTHRLILGFNTPQTGLRPITPEAAVAGDVVVFSGHVGLYDPSDAPKSLYSATNHGVMAQDPKFWKGPAKYFRVRVPCK